MRPIAGRREVCCCRLPECTHLAFAALFGAVDGFILWRGDPLALPLSPEGLKAPGLDRTIPWETVTDLDMTLSQGTMVTRLLLPPEAAFPQRVPGGRNVKFDRKCGIVTVSVGLPHGMKPQDYADLIGRHRATHQARRILAERS